MAEKRIDDAKLGRISGGVTDVDATLGESHPVGGQERPEAEQIPGGGITNISKK